MSKAERLEKKRKARLRRKVRRLKRLQKDVGVQSYTRVMRMCDDFAINMDGYDWRAGK